MCGIFKHRQQEFLNLHPQLGWRLLEPTFCYLTQFHVKPFWKTYVSFRLPIVCLEALISLSHRLLEVLKQYWKISLLFCETM